MPPGPGLVVITSSPVGLLPTPAPATFSVSLFEGRGAGVTGGVTTRGATGPAVGPGEFDPIVVGATATGAAAGDGVGVEAGGAWVSAVTAASPGVVLIG